MINERRICEIESTLLKIEDKITRVADDLKLHRRETLDRLKSVNTRGDKTDSKLDHLIQTVDMILRAVQKLDSHCIKIDDHLASLKENLSLLSSKAEQRHHSLDQRIVKIDRRFDNIANRFDQIQKLMNDQFSTLSKNTDEGIDRLHHELRETLKLLIKPKGE